MARLSTEKDMEWGSRYSKMAEFSKDNGYLIRSMVRAMKNFQAEIATREIIFKAGRKAKESTIGKMARSTKGNGLMA